VGANFPRRYRPADDHEPGQRGDRGEARLWRLGTVLAVSFTVAVVGLAGLAWLAWALLGLAGYRRHGAPELKDTVSVLQLVFATVAGAGALVALIVAYRRQKITEADSAHDRTRVFNERFTAIATQLGDAQPAVRLAGVHAMAGSPMTGSRTGRPASTCCAPICACRTTRIRATTPPRPTGPFTGRTGRCVTPSSGSSVLTCAQDLRCPGEA
jgi:hypothetical protein